jgi:hypothetical protein
VGEECRLKVFGNIVLKKILAEGGHEYRAMRKLHNKEPHNTPHQILSGSSNKKL